MAARVAVWAALFVAFGYFAWRGIWRAMLDSGNFAVGYSAAQAWWGGHNPYDPAVLQAALTSSGGDPTVVDGLGRLLNVYFPPTLPLFVPLAVEPWPLARLTFLGLNVGATFLIGLGLAHLMGWRLSSVRSLALTGTLLALAPVHTTVAEGQTALVATAGIVVAMLLERSGRAGLAGLASGLATAAKVQIGLPFLIYLVWRRRFRTASWAGIVLLGLSTLSVIRMSAAGVPWLASWLANLTATSSPGGLNDASRLNPDRFSLINLQYPLSTLINNTTAVELITLGFVALMGVVVLVLARSRGPGREMIVLSVLATLSLLVIYHRYYDAVLLALPIAWALSTIRTSMRRYAVVTLCLCADFLLPMQTALNSLQDRPGFPHWITDNVIWQSVVLAQHAWALVLLVFVLLLAILKGDGNLEASWRLWPAPSAAAGRPGTS